MTTQLNELDNGPRKVKNLPKINYGKGLRPEGTAARVAKEQADVKKKKEQDKFDKKIKRSIDDLQKIIDRKVKVTITYSDYMMAWNGFPDLDPHDIISGIAKRTGGDFDHIQKQMDKFAKQDGYKNFMDGYYEQVKKFHEDPEGYLESTSLEEMAMDSISHKKFGKLGWHNEGGVHKIKRNGKTIFSGTHKEAAKHWSTIKHITESVCPEEFLESSKTLYPGAKVVVGPTGRRVGEVYKNEKHGWFGFHHDKSDYGAEGHNTEEEALEDFHDHHNSHSRSGQEVHQNYFKFKKQSTLKESDKNKLRNLAHQNPEAADAAAALIRAYMDNPKKPISQVVTKVCEETGIAKAQLMKVVAELGINFDE